MGARGGRGCLGGAPSFFRIKPCGGKAVASGTPGRLSNYGFTRRRRRLIRVSVGFIPLCFFKLVRIILLQYF
jgi:hypothetical protein